MSAVEKEEIFKMVDGLLVPIILILQT